MPGGRVRAWLIGLPGCGRLRVAYVLRLLARRGTLLIFGPGEAKLQLKDRIGRFKGLCDCVVGIETTDTLTNPQIVARVKEHFGFARDRGRRRP